MHIVSLRPDLRTVAPQTAPSTSPAFFDAESREQGKLRRERERTQRTFVSEWFNRDMVITNTKEDGGFLLTVGVTLPFDHIHDRERECMRIRIPVGDHAYTWRPRVCSLLWSEPYVFFFRSLCVLLNASSVASLGLAWEHSSERVTRKRRERANQAIERAMNTICYGEAKAACNTLVVPAVGNGTQQAWGRDRRSICKIEFPERVAGEQRKLRDTMELCRTVGHGLPALYTKCGIDKIVHYYTIGRLAQPCRNSQLQHIPMQLASIIRALLPHLVPIAPDARTAEVLANCAHEHLQKHHHTWMESLRQNRGAS